MKKIILIFLFFSLFFIFMGCEKKELNTKEEYEAFVDNNITLEEKEETIQFLEKNGEIKVGPITSRVLFVAIYLQGSKEEIDNKVKTIKKHKNIKKIDTAANLKTFEN